MDPWLGMDETFVPKQYEPEKYMPRFFVIEVKAWYFVMVCVYRKNMLSKCFKNERIVSSSKHSMVC